jgi:predicted DNA-binding transcriptional regulator AlpA
MKFLSMKAVCALLSLSRAQIDRLADCPEYAHFGFPKKRHIGFRVVFWEHEILDWMSTR